VKVIARIPLLESPAVAAAPALDPPTQRPPRDRPPRRAREASALRPRFPGVSVSVLAVLAVVVWMLASWNDGRRLARARQERMARIQAFEAASGTVAR
jgi:hypothetical protein